MENDKEVTLTYETLYEILRKEKSRDELQKLDPAFLRNILNYLKEKQQSYDDNLTKNDIFSQSERDKLHIQIANIKKIMKDLYDIRERKIINMAISKSRTNAHIVDMENLHAQETAMFESISSVLTQYRTGVLHRILEQREPDILPIILPLPQETEQLKDEKIQVKFTDKVEQFVGKELELYGPYEANDEATLPNDLAEILITQGKAISLNS